MKRSQEYTLLSELLNNGYEVTFGKINLFKIENVIGKKYQVYIDRGASYLFEDMSKAINSFLDNKYKIYKGRKNAQL